MQRTGLRVGRACYQSHTHQLEPFNWDGDGVRGIYDARHPSFDLYMTPLEVTRVTTMFRCCLQWVAYIMLFSSNLIYILHFWL